jgi:hypothetical protein
MGQMHYVFHCRCSCPIVFPSETLGQVIVPPNTLPTNPHSVGVVCGQCKRVRSYSADTNAQDYDPTMSAVLQDLKPTPMFVEWLTCEEEICGTRLALFSPVSISTDPEERRKELATWAWGDDLLCPRGHHIPKPAILNL